MEMTDFPMLAEMSGNIAKGSPWVMWPFTLMLLGCGAGLLLAAYVAAKNAQVISNTATSRIRSAAQGYVELEGRTQALSGAVLQSPLTGRSCCWWEYRIEELQDSTTTSTQNRTWRTLEFDTSKSLFLLEDSTGQCLVDPEGGGVHCTERTWHGDSRQPPRPQGGDFAFDIGGSGTGKYRYTEQLISIGAPLFVIGQIRSQSSYLEAVKASARRDNDDDQSDCPRQLAAQQMQALVSQQMLATDIDVICESGDSRPFLLSTNSQKESLADLRRMSRYCLFGGLAFSIVGVFFMDALGAF